MAWKHCAAVVLSAWVACALLLAQGGAATESPAVATPPEAFFEKVRPSHRLSLIHISEPTRPY